MNKIQIIEKREVLGKQFEMYGTFEEPLFLAKDVAEWIDYSKSGNGSYNVPQMLSLLEDEEKLVSTLLVAGQNRQVSFLTEDGLYEVLMQSRKPIAKSFKKEVKKILKSLRTGKSKIVSMTEYQQMMVETRMENAKIRKARELSKLAEKYKGKNFAQILDSYATKELTGEYLIPLPALEQRTYSAGEIAEMLDITANRVGRLANLHNLKTTEYGRLVADKSAHSNKEVESFRYYENVIPILQELLKQIA